MISLFCPEITTKVSNLGIPIYEVPISYKGRTYEDGKKFLLRMVLRRYIQL